MRKRSLRWAANQRPSKAPCSLACSRTSACVAATIGLEGCSAQNVSSQEAIAGRSSPFAMSKDLTFFGVLNDNRLFSAETNPRTHDSLNNVSDPNCAFDRASVQDAQDCMPIPLTTKSACVGCEKTNTAPIVNPHIWLQRVIALPPAHNPANK